MVDEQGQTCCELDSLRSSRTHFVHCFPDNVFIIVKSHVRSVCVFLCGHIYACAWVCVCLYTLYVSLYVSVCAWVCLCVCVCVKLKIFTLARIHAAWPNIETARVQVLMRHSSHTQCTTHCFRTSANKQKQSKRNYTKSHHPTYSEGDRLGLDQPVGNQCFNRLVSLRPVGQPVGKSFTGWTGWNRLQTIEWGKFSQVWGKFRPGGWFWAQSGDQFAINKDFPWWCWFNNF